MQIIVHHSLRHQDRRCCHCGACLWESNREQQPPAVFAFSLLRAVLKCDPAARELSMAQNMARLDCMDLGKAVVPNQYTEETCQREWWQDRSFEMQAEGRMAHSVVVQWKKIPVPCLRLKENTHYYKIIIFPNFSFTLPGGD